MKLSDLQIEQKISLTGVITAAMAFMSMLAGLAAMVGGWYTFSNRIANSEVAITELKQERIEDLAQREKLNDTLVQVNATLGTVKQALEDNHIHLSTSQ